MHQEKEQNILELLYALNWQTVQAKEIVICDAGSRDATPHHISTFAKKYPQLNITLITKPGNRSVGRNAAIQKTTTKLIAITDAGCVPERNWLEELSACHKKCGAPVIAGYYFGLPATPLEEAIVPYALVMPTRVKGHEFLPATRSMLIEKQVFEKHGGFDERYSDNEDYVFARKLQQKNVPMAFCPKAQVGWMPRSSLSQFWTMIYRFARGDGFAGLWRPKVGCIYIRYLLALLAVGLWLSAGISLVPLFFFGVVGLVLYSYWAIQKNIVYVPSGWQWLPVLQIISDLAVMLGTAVGVFHRFRPHPHGE